ncbi:MAG: formate dehydrogenase accessory sulfurtransferase FdhD [Methanoregulaceae archaeon]|nr:formate dehydrogenase accessory sulfurtransferase FdhD [Methanoregulaceae archaeon]
MFSQVPCIRVNGAEFTSSVHEVAVEEPVALFVNGRHALTAMMSPYMIREFVTGFLYTERIIHAPDEIESIRFDEKRVSVLTKNPFRILASKKTVLSGCGGSTSFLDVGKLPKVVSDLSVTREEVRAAIKGVLSSELHTLTGGVHVVGLLEHDRVIVVAEDIGRHNALDRVIGFGLLNDVSFGRTFVVSSGRISSEMVRKCLIAGIPVIVSRGATTSLAVEVASQTGVTLIGFARGEKMNIYTCPERFVGAPGSGP